MKGYLCGGIFGLDDGAVNNWRTTAKERMPDIEWVDPMRRDYRGKEAGNCRAIVEDDLADIAGCDFLLVWAETPSWGTAMEMVYARQQGKRIVTFCRGTISPWLQYHSSVIVWSWRDAETAIRSKVMRDG